MSPNTHNNRVKEIRPLSSPKALMEELPLDDADTIIIAQTRAEIGSMIHEPSPKLLVIVGPCSIHDTKAAQEYAQFILKMRQKHSENLTIVMRTYFEKPRTTIGWKGLIYDPLLDGSCDIECGLRTARKLLIDINHLGVPVAVEFLDTISPEYISELVSWGCIGARTAESQIHRQLASGLSCPIGIKNSTDGSVQIALDAVASIKSSHEFLGIDDRGIASIVKTTGNDDTHIILRGSNSGPNYSKEDVEKIEKITEKYGPIKIMIDCSHGNSCKDYRRQRTVCESIAEQVSDGSKSIMGVMIESNIVAGNQKLGDPSMLQYGQSITDGCVDLAETEVMLDMLSSAVKTRRGK